MNVMKADCGFDPHAMDAFKDVTVDAISDVEGFSLKGYTNMHVNLAAESSDVSIEDFNDMQPGKEYMIIAYNGTITKANNMTIVYKFFTDGHSIYCSRAIYA